MLTQELNRGIKDYIWESGSKERLLQMFPMSDDEENGMLSFTESYHKYKREYVKHLSFNPEEENLSKCIFDYSSSFVSSFCAETCANGGSVHLL